jgi:toxin ParE1/3/4
MASEVVHRIEAAAERVGAHPFHGRPRNDILPGLRAVLVHPYVIFYRVGEGEVEVVRVLHERRDLPALLRNKGKAD